MFLESLREGKQNLFVRFDVDVDDDYNAADGNDGNFLCGHKCVYIITGFCKVFTVIDNAFVDKTCNRFVYKQYNTPKVKNKYNTTNYKLFTLFHIKKTVNQLELKESTNRTQAEINRSRQQGQHIRSIQSRSIVGLVLAGGRRLGRPWDQARQPRRQPKWPTQRRIRTAQNKQSNQHKN